VRKVGPASVVLAGLCVSFCRFPTLSLAFDKVHIPKASIFRLSKPETEALRLSPLLKAHRNVLEGEIMKKELFEIFPVAAGGIRQKRDGPRPSLFGEMTKKRPRL